MSIAANVTSSRISAGVSGGAVSASVGSGCVAASVAGSVVSAAVGSGRVAASVGGGAVSASVGNGRVAASVTGGIGPQGPAGAVGETGGVTTLSELTDVQLTALANGDLIQYSTATSKWRNVTDLSLVDGGNFTWLIASGFAGLQAVLHLSTC